jgi:hypothetical protein
LSSLDISEILAQYCHPAFVITFMSPFQGDGKMSGGGFHWDGHCDPAGAADEDIQGFHIDGIFDCTQFGVTLVANLVALFKLAGKLRKVFRVIAVRPSSFVQSFSGLFDLARDSRVFPSVLVALVM